MNSKVRILVALAVSLLAAPALSGGDRVSKKASELMHRKLVHAQKILEGVALGDFNSITRHAEELMLISKDVEWHVVKTPRYEVHSNEFRRAVEGLIDKAREKNLDGAALGYVDLTLTCVRCHKYVRDVRMTRQDPDRTGYDLTLGRRNGF